MSCDSMQIYKDMDIGTAKPTVEERGLVPHHLVDFVEPNISYSCMDFVNDATIAVDDIVSRGKLPIFCGGTGLYLDRFLKGGNEETAENDLEYRKKMLEYAKEHGATELHRLLETIDPESADAIHPNNVKRVVRALEIFHITGEKKSTLDKRYSEMSDEYDATVLYLHYNDREILNGRICRRVDEMIERGLCEETLHLYLDGVFEKNTTAAQAIGYKELLPYVRGEDSLEACVERLKIATKRYAKRQNTWFSSKPYTVRVEMDDENGAKTFEEIVNISEKLFRKDDNYGIIV